MSSKKLFSRKNHNNYLNQQFNGELIFTFINKLIPGIVDICNTNSKEIQMYETSMLKRESSKKMIDSEQHVSFKKH